MPTPRVSTSKRPKQKRANTPAVTDTALSQNLADTDGADSLEATAPPPTREASEAESDEPTLALPIEAAAGSSGDEDLPADEDDLTDDFVAVDDEESEDEDEDEDDDEDEERDDR